MRKILLASAALLLLPMATAKADLILTEANGTPAVTIPQSFTDLGAEGFGHAPRLLTLQTTGTESGSGTPVNVANGDAVPGMDKTTTPTLGALGWVNGTNVGIGFNSNQTGGTGITLAALALTIYNGTTALATFNLDPAETPLVFSATDLALQQGNGNAVFNFGLNAAERAQFNAIEAMPGSANFFAGLSSTLTGANDGADSFLAFTQPASVPGPIAGAGIPGLVMACLGMVGLARRRIMRLRGLVHF